MQRAVLGARAQSTETPTGCSYDLRDADRDELSQEHRTQFAHAVNVGGARYRNAIGVPLLHSGTGDSVKPLARRMQAKR
jgi:hypothetical protein